MTLRIERTETLRVVSSDPDAAAMTQLHEAVAVILDAAVSGDPQARAMIDALDDWRPAQPVEEEPFSSYRDLWYPARREKGPISCQELNYRQARAKHHRSIGIPAYSGDAEFEHVPVPNAVRRINNAGEWVEVPRNPEPPQVLNPAARIGRLEADVFVWRSTTIISTVGMLIAIVAPHL